MPYSVTSLCTSLVDSEEFTETGETMLLLVGRILLVEMFILTCWKGIIRKKLFRVIQKLSAHILYKLKVQKCPEIAAKNNLIVCLLNIVKNSKTVKQHFQFLG